MLFLMPEWLQTLSWYTFNGWALDGFQQVFWYDVGPDGLGRHMLILLACSALFVGLARWRAGRWVSK